jgi:hypothetical protein
MAKDRDHVDVTIRARRDAERIRAAWDRYVETGAALAAIRPCSSIWPNSVHDVAPTQCQLLQGHNPGEDDGGHRHRILGTQVTVTW